uniref:Uncharacterized protein n=1 Tax=Siphoviridae sp. ctTnV63 TaxID=2825523 RepID=A0A8S5NW88_9CAUD|nr:MAG TPA: hypothetical protein [Siphoviridae sp. ctTnV63]
MERRDTINFHDATAAQIEREREREEKKWKYLKQMYEDWENSQEYLQQYCNQEENK